MSIEAGVYRALCKVWRPVLAEAGLLGAELDYETRRNVEGELARRRRTEETLATQPLTLRRLGM
jgi:hypothetical protein